jgi:hypothetical protein
VYGWHDGRLHALSTVARSPGAEYVGRWTIPVIVDGRRSAIAGGLWHAEDLSIVWFWSIVVLLAWALARLLLRRPSYLFFLVVSVAALWRGVELVPTLRDGFVLAAVPPFLARVTAVLCLATAVSLLLLVFRMSQRRDQGASDDPDGWTDDRELEDEAAWELEV